MKIMGIWVKYIWKKKFFVIKKLIIEIFKLGYKSFKILKNCSGICGDYYLEWWL